LLGYAHHVQVLTRGITRNVLDSSDGVGFAGELVVLTKITGWFIAHGQVVLWRGWCRTRILRRFCTVRVGIAAAVAVLVL
jgi:hypothetical protein